MSRPAGVSKVKVNERSESVATEGSRTRVGGHVGGSDTEQTSHAAVPDWEHLRQSVRAFIGSKLEPDVQRAGGSGLKGQILGRADELSNVTLLKLLERAEAGEKFRNSEAAAVTEAKWVVRAYWDSRTQAAKDAREAQAVLTPNRGKKSPARSTKIDAPEFHRIGGVRLPNQPSDHQGRLPKSSPRRRQPVVIYLADGSQIILKSRKAQRAWKSATTHGEPISLVFALVAYAGPLPAPPWAGLQREFQRLDRRKWRALERTILDKTPREREIMLHAYRARIKAPSIKEPDR